MKSTLQSSFVNYENEEELTMYKEEFNEIIDFNNEENLADDDENGFLEIKNEIENVLKRKEDIQVQDTLKSENSSIDNSFAIINASMWENKKNQKENSFAFFKKFDELKKKRNSMKNNRYLTSKLLGKVNIHNTSKKNKTKDHFYKKSNFRKTKYKNTEQDSETKSNSEENVSFSTTLSTTYLTCMRRNSIPTAKSEDVFNNNLFGRSFQFNDFAHNNEYKKNQNFGYLNSLSCKFKGPNLGDNINRTNNASPLSIKSSVFLPHLNSELIKGNFSNQQYQQINVHNKNPFEVLKELEYDYSQKNNLDDAPNRISLENILKGKDKRTTLMIRHIPNKYNLKSIMDEIDEDFKGKYDFFYLPLDYVNSCNLGYAFINFVDSMHIIQFYCKYRAKRWKKFNSEKICELAYAKFQGKKQLVNHFEKGTVMNINDPDKKPVILPTPVFPPRVEIPIKFYDAFAIFYPYSCVYILRDSFIVISFGFE